MYSRDAVYYDALNKSLQTEDLPFYASMIPDGAVHICEAACGTGRIILSLYQEGRTLSGFDASENMLQIAEKKSRTLGIPVCWRHADMPRLPELEPVDLMICGYNSLQHLKEEAEVLQYLQNSRDCMSAKGLFIIDVFNPDERFLFPQGNRRLLAVFVDGEGNSVRVEEETMYEPDTGINHITYHYYMEGQYIFSEKYFMKQYLPDVLDGLIMKSGLKIQNKFGDYQKTPFAEDSPKQIYILSR